MKEKLSICCDAEMQEENDQCIGCGSGNEIDKKNFVLLSRDMSGYKTRLRLRDMIKDIIIRCEKLRNK